jgi:hypothetical protein
LNHGVLELQAIVDGADIPDSDRQEFTALVDVVGPAFGLLAEQAEVDFLEVECVLAANFVTAVEARMKRLSDGDQEGFTTERVGGVVAAKNLPQAADDSRVAIVFAHETLRALVGGTVNRAAFVAHEIAHSVLSRVRRMSGALDGVVFPSQTLTEISRSSARIDWDEFRAEALADQIIQAMATVTEAGGGSRPLRLAEISGPGYLEQAKTQLAAAYPAWPDRVQAYREYRLALGDMWIATLRSVGQMRTLMAMMMGALGIDSDAPVDPELAALPAYRLYFGALWDEYINTVRHSPILTTVSEHREIELTVLRAGEASFRFALLALGLTADDLPDRQAHVHVVAPQRLQ